MDTHTYYIGMGSNVAGASALLACARFWMCRLLGRDIRFSAPVNTEPVDFPWPALFTNQVAMVVCAKEPAALGALLKRIERLLGRLPQHKRQGVMRIDLDILCADGQVLRQADWNRPDVVEAVRSLGRCL
mgnify:CR=1 FL=1